MRWLVLCLAAALACSGCLVESKDSETDAPDFDSAVPVGLFVPAAPAASAETPQPETPAADYGDAGAVQQVTTQKPIAEHAGGYTGAIVYVSTDCVPCHNLLDDLRFLAENYHWEVADIGQQRQPPDSPAADWLISHAEGLDSYPVVQFYLDGDTVGSFHGYNPAASFSERSATLRDLVHEHPKKWAPRK